MTKAEKIGRLRNLTQAYILYGLTTRLPFIECEQGNFYDQAFIYEAKEDAEEAARRFGENGDMVAPVELKVVQDTLPKEGEGAEPGKVSLRNQVRVHLLRLPLLGLNAVFFKPAGENGEVLELDYVIPEEAKKFVDEAKTDLAVVQLTGLYFAQSLRRKEKNKKQIGDCSEEFYANLVRAELLLPVIPTEEQPEEDRVNLAKSRIPCFPIKKKDSEETFSFLTLFTNMDEVTAYCRSVNEKAKVVKIPFKNIYDIINDPMIGCVIDPLSLCIPVAKEEIPKLTEMFGA